MSEIVLRPMLAHSDPVLPEQINIGPQGVWLAPKYDGIRSWRRNMESQTRTLKLIPNLHIQQTLKHPALEGMDGELIVGDPTHENCYHITESAVMSRGGQPDFTYFVFDLWDTPNVGFRQRYATLKRKLRALMNSGLPVTLVMQRLCHTHPEIRAALEELYVENWEGAIVRSYNDRYKYNRSTLNEGFMLKLKEHVDSEFRITGFVEQTTNTNAATIDERGFTKRSSHKANKVAAGTLGKFEGIDIHSGMEINVGPGKLTAPQKQEIWENQERFMGNIGKYRSAKHGILVKPRHPRWIGWSHASDVGDPD